MNKFRVNLHPAFFDPKTGMEYHGSSDHEFEENDGTKRVSGYYFNENTYDASDNTYKAGELDEVVSIAKRVDKKDKPVDNLSDERAKEQMAIDLEVKGLGTEVQSEFQNVTGNVASEISSKYTDMNQLRNDRSKFQERLRSKDSRGEEYARIWEKKIAEGFGFLKTSLKESGYFKGKNEEEELSKIRELYMKEVYAQYEKYIWNGGDKSFDSIKDKIFGDDSEEYPANKIYCQLTGATTIFRKGRTYVEGYDTDSLEPISLDGVEDASEDMSDRQNRNFLSDDLPKYLWNIKKTSGFVNALKWLPIFSVKEDRPSKVDRKAIKQFLKVSSKIAVEGDKDKALALMEVLHDNALKTNSGRDDYRAVLTKHGVTVEDKYIDDIVKVGSFYIKTQSDNNSAREQHAIYLSVLTAIEKKGGVKEAVNYFKPMVEQSEKDKKTEKKEGYESGEKLGATNPELYEIATNLGITDFASATRLAEKDSKYFEKTPVEKILANLNNDRDIDARDSVVGGSKTGTQFLEIFRQVGKEKALSNLVKHAKLVNKTMGVGLPDQIFNPDTIEENIKGGHTGLILLLQNIITKPGEDLYTLLSGHSENPFEGVDLVAEKAASEKAAADMIKKMDLEALKRDGLTLPTPESMQSGLATALYTEYKRGIGLGGKVSFDEWIKGVEMNTGFQVREGGVVMVGIGLDYHKKINLGKGWSTTPELSAGAFIPLGMGKPELSGSVGLNDEVAKERVTKKGIREHLGVQGGVTLMPAGVVVLSAGLNWSQDKLAGIESAEQKKMVEFRDKIISPILDDMYEACKMIKMVDATKLNFDDKTLIDVYRNSILKVAKQQEVPVDKQEMVTNAIMRLLVNYNGADLAQEGVKDVIAQGVAEQYAMAWAEDRKAHITDKAYLSGANLGAFWVAGSPLVGIYAGVKFTKHDLDGYGDRRGAEHLVDNSEKGGEWTNEMIGDLNQRLGLSPEKGLKIEGSHIVIPQTFVHRVLVSDDMKELMIKDDNGNILLDTHTPMQERVWTGAATQGTELLIGSKPRKIKLDQAGSDWFTKGEINQDAVLALNEGIDKYDVNVLNKALNDLKGKISNENDPIKKWSFSELTSEEQQALIAKFDSLDKNQKVRLIIVNNRGKIEVKDPENAGEGRGLEIEYQTKSEMIDANAKNVADAVYVEALKLKNPRALNAVKHQPWSQYTEFNNAMQSKEYEKAKQAIVSLFARLDDEIKDNNVSFKNILDGEAFKNLEGDALVQALMSINNIFARSKQVRGGNGNYEFIGPNGKAKEMKAIIKERYKILDTLKAKVKDSEALQRYESLFNATSKHVESDLKFGQTSAKAASLGNTVGFNLGDKTNPENPLFNPEIYDPMVELDKLEGFSKDAKEGLHKRAMSLFAKNPALVNPILKAVGVDTSNLNLENLVNSGNMKVNGDKCELTLDINGKKVTISAGMKFGFFTQCVNHTIILDDISAETDETKATFNSGVWKDGVYQEGNQSIIDSSTEVGASVSVIVHDGKKSETKREDDATTTPTEEEEDIPNDGSTTPGAQDEGSTGTGGSAEQGGEGQSGSQSGDRGGEGTGDSTPPTGGEGQTTGGTIGKGR